MFSKISRAVKKVLVIGYAVAMAIFLACPTRAADSMTAGLTGYAVEQVRARMPQIEVYFYTEEDLPVNTSIEAYLDGKALAWTGTMERNSFGTNYIILLDSSGSIWPEHLAAAKAEIIRLAGNLGRADSITLITFGDEVELQVSSSRDTARIKEALQKAEGQDQNTCFYEAIKMGLEYARTVGGDERQVMMIVSDGMEDTSSGGITRQEIETLLRQSNMPVYALCANHAGSAQQEEFGSFARETGGKLLAFSPQNAQQVWGELTSWLEGAVRICFEADSNRIDGGEHALLVKLRSGGSEENYTHPVSLWNWVPDTLPPEVETFVYLPKENALELRFSEPVLGAVEPENYLLKTGEQIFTPIEAVQLEDGGVRLSLPEKLPVGQYTVTLLGIRDDSMEENPLREEVFSFRKKRAIAELGPFLLGVTAAAFGVTLILVILRRSRRPENKESVKTVCEIQHVEVRPQAPVSSPSPDGPAVRLHLEIAGGPQAGQRLEIRIGRSAIWGRSSRMCDVCLHDPKISHQHCVLEVRENGLWLTDLNSQNGTYINGIRLNGSHRLQAEDLIRMGDTALQVKKILVEAL